MKFYYRNGMEILEGDMFSNLAVPSFIKVAYIEEIGYIKQEIKAKLLITSKIKFVNKGNTNITTVKDGLKFDDFSLLMRKERHEKFLKALLDKPFPEMNYEIDKGYLTLWKK